MVDLTQNIKPLTDQSSDDEVIQYMNYLKNSNKESVNNNNIKPLTDQSSDDEVIQHMRQLRDDNKLNILEQPEKPPVNFNYKKFDISTARGSSKGYTIGELQQNDEFNFDDIRNAVSVLYKHNSTSTDVLKQFVGLFNEETALKYDKTKRKINTEIVNKLKELNIDAHFDEKSGDVYARLKPNTAYVQADSTFFQDLKNSKYELYGGISGGILGAGITAAEIGKKGLTQPNLLGKVAGGLLYASGSALGGIGLGLVGRVMDDISNLQEIGAELDMLKSINNAIKSIPAEGVLGLSAGLVQESILGAGRGAWKAIAALDRKYGRIEVRAYDTIITKILGITHETADEIVEKHKELFEKRNPSVIQKLTKGQETREKLQILLQTETTGENVAGQLFRGYNVTTSQYFRNISEEATAIFDAIKEKIPDEVRENLHSYVRTTGIKAKMNYNSLDEILKNVPELTKYKVKKNNKIVHNSIKSISADLKQMDRQTAEPESKKFLVTLQNMLKDAKDFDDLNQFDEQLQIFDNKYGEHYSKNDGIQTLRKKSEDMLFNVFKDSLGNQTANRLQHVKQSLKQDWVMHKKLENDSIIKGLRESNNPTEWARKFIEHKGYVGSDFKNAMTTLPLNERTMVERMAVVSIMEQYATETAEKVQVIDFAKALKELQDLYKPANPDSKYIFKDKSLKNAVDDLITIGQALRNTQEIINSKSITTSRSAPTALTKELLSKVQYASMSSVWDRVLAYMPIIGNTKAIQVTLNRMAADPLQLNLDRKLLSALDELNEPLLKEHILSLNALINNLKINHPETVREIVTLNTLTSTDKVFKASGELGEGYYVSLNSIPDKTKEELLKNISELHQFVPYKEYIKTPEIYKKELLGTYNDKKIKFFKDDNVKKSEEENKLFIKRNKIEELRLKNETNQ